MVLNLFKTLGAGKTDSALPVHRRQQRTVSGSRSNATSPVRQEVDSGSARVRGPSPSRRLSRYGAQSTSSCEPTPTTPGAPPAAVAAVMSRLGHTLSGSSVSAPGSPSSSSAKASSIPLKTRVPAATAATGVVVRPPAANIVVEKGRIEFAKTGDAFSPSAPALSQIETGATVAATSSSSSSSVAALQSNSSSSNNNNNHLSNGHKSCKLGAKIFRPSVTPTGSPRVVRHTESSTTPPEEPAHPPPIAIRRKEVVPAGSFVSLRDRSASPKWSGTRSREPTPPPPPPTTTTTTSTTTSSDPPASKIPAARKSDSKLIPRPGFIRSRESSPASSTCSIPASASASAASSSKAAPAATKAAQPGSIPVPVSPNLIRWRAKLTSTSAPPPPPAPAAAGSGSKTKTTSTGKMTTASGIRRPSSCASSASSDDRSKVATRASEASEATASAAAPNQQTDDVTTPADDDNNSGAMTASADAEAIKSGDASMTSSSQSEAPASSSCSAASPASLSASDSSPQPNQMQLLNLHYEVKRLEETVQTLLPLRHQQSALIQSYEERLAEAQARLATAESEVAQLKERLARSESAETEARQLVQQLEAEKAAASSSFEQQRVTFDKCLDEIANHVVQALISQKNLQGECRRLRSQVSDLEQRNVALNLLLTQSLRESMLENNKKQAPTVNGVSDGGGGMVKSCSYDVSASLMMPANPRDSMCSAVSDSEIRLSNCASIFDASSGVRPLVSKDSNWTLSSTASSSSSSSASQAALSAQQAHENPVERAEKLLAVLKHRLFSAQLNSYKSIQQRASTRPNSARHSLVLPDVTQQQQQQEAPARPSTLTFCVGSVSAPSTVSGKDAADSHDPTTPSVRALVQVLEQRVTGHQPAPADSKSQGQRPPLAPGLVRAVRNLPAGAGSSELHNDSPASKDEGYSTMSSDVQVDSSSSSSSFIASGCSSPATLRRSTGPSAPASRSLPMAKRKTLLTASCTSTESARPQPNRSISLQETHSGAGLEELKEEGSDELTNDECVGRLASDQPDSASIEAPRAASAPSFKREWPGVQLGTLCEDWSPSSADSDSSDVDDKPAASKKPNQDASVTKWTSDSELYKADQEDDSPAEHCKTLQLKGRHYAEKGKETRHPLRRTRAETQLSNEAPNQPPPAKKAPNYSQHEMEDWIMDGEHDPAPSESGESAAAVNALPAISEISYESDGDDEAEEDDEPLFVPDCSSPECQEAEGDAEDDEEDDEHEESVDTEFTRDYYRLVKFESNRSLANSEKYDHCAPEEGASSASSGTAPMLPPPPDRQVALQTVLDFIAEQQRYCARRETDDAAVTGAPGSADAGVSSLVQLRNLIPEDEDDDDDGSSSSDSDDAFHDGFATKWLPVRSSQAKSIDLANLEIRAAMLDKLVRSSSSSSCDSNNCNPFEDRHCQVYRLDDTGTTATTDESHC